MTLLASISTVPSDASWDTPAWVIAVLTIGIVANAIMGAFRLMWRQNANISQRHIGSQLANVARRIDEMRESTRDHYVEMHKSMSALSSEISRMQLDIERRLGPIEHQLNMGTVRDRSMPLGTTAAQDGGQP